MAKYYHSAKERRALGKLLRACISLLRRKARLDADKVRSSRARKILGLISADVWANLAVTRDLARARYNLLA